MITLPTSKVPATSTNPKFLILYGRPEVLGLCQATDIEKTSNF